MAHILVIEDNPANMKLATFLLKQAGHEVLEAIDAEQGIQQARTHLPALIFMDMQLPGMDGMQATRVLRMSPETRDIKIVALTAFAMSGDEEKFLAAGCDGYLAKPIRYQEFFKIIEKMLAA